MTMNPLYMKMQIRSEMRLAFDQTVAIGAAGEPIAPGKRRGGAVNKNRERPWARSQLAKGVRCHNSPK